MQAWVGRHQETLQLGIQQSVRNQTRMGEWNGQTWTWLEQQLVVYSLACTQSAQQAFQTRLEHAQTALAALNQLRRGQKAFPDEDSSAQAAETFLTRYRVNAYVQLG